ncbi:hypothetical protein BDF19DRAFT_477008 [Syncephalis fuscata]|nr:hypothetical protein BDF19DRAFT_477008 [Syncephalis fuscata]
MLKQSTIYNNSSYIKNVTNEKTHAHWLTAYNTRLQAYTQQGALKAVEYVWKEMLDHPGLAPNRMSWNTRINAHARFGDVDDMEQYAKDMAILHRIKWDAYTQQALLVGYGRAGRWDAVARIRGILEQREALRITSNIKYDKSNALPSKKTDEQSAFSFPTPNVHTYTALMSLQIEKKDYIGAGRTLRWMLSAGIQPTQATVNLMSQRAADPDNWHPNAHTVAILIDACSRYGAYEEMHRIRQIVVALGVRFTIATLTALAIGYAKAGRSQDARQFATQAREAALNESSHSRPLSKEVIFNASLRSDGAINTAERARGGSRVAEAISLCCAVIRALGDANCPDGAQAVWQDLLHSGLPLGADEHNTWLYVLGKRKDFHTLRLCYYERVMALFPRDTLEQSIDDSNELFTHVVRGPPANVKTFAIMIHIMATYGKIGLAEYLYQQLLWLADLSPYLHFWKTQSNSDNGLYKPRLQLVAQDHANIFSILVSARLRRNDDEGAYDQYHQLAPSLKAALSVPIYTALMDAAARKKRWSRLYALLNDMLANGHSLDTKAYNVLLRAHTADCMEIMKERGNDMAPDARTFAIVITAAIRHQRHDLVWSWLKELGDPNAYTEQAPNTASESPILCNQVLATEIIRWYAMNGNLPAAEAAYQRIQQLPANKVNSKRPIIPDITARHTLLSAYARQGDIVNAARIYKEFKADGFKPTSQTFAILLTCCRRSIARQLISLRENDVIESHSTFLQIKKQYDYPWY